MDNKLKIQYIRYDEISRYSDITSVTVDEIINFDNFDYNIIDLRNDSIFLEYMKYFKTFEIKMRVLKKSLNSNHSNVFILLPNHKIAEYDIRISSVIQYLLDIPMCQVEYERNYTTLENVKLENSYYFKLSSSNSELLQANRYDDTNQNKITILKKENILISSINLTIPNIAPILPILFKENLSSIEVPDWAKNIEAFDDIELKKKNDNLEKELKKITTQLKEINDKLIENNKYKSILYTNGNILQETVKEMLNDIFKDSLKNFKDIKKEDFLIELDNDITFIGEVKGVNTNVKNPHIHQIVGRQLDYEEINPNKETHPILVINYLRDRDIANRDNISAEQIKYAKRNYCLIISTINFLKLYEKYKKQELTKEDIIKIFKNENNIGEFKFD